MLHKMKLHSSPFELIQSGKKDIELRLNDEKRRLIRIGDLIEFTNTTTGEAVSCVVLDKFEYDSFAELYPHFDKIRMGYTEDEIADPLDMEKYYSPEEIEKCGVLAIQITLLDKLTPAMLVDHGICPTCFDKETNGTLYGDKRSKLIYDDSIIECFFVGNPRAEGHVAISSKDHYKDMSEIPDSLCEHVFIFAKRLMNVIKNVYNCESVYLCTMCDGPMNHFHIQLIPRYFYEKRGSKNFVKPRKPYIEDYKKMAEIKSMLN